MRICSERLHIHTPQESICCVPKFTCRDPSGYFGVVEMGVIRLNAMAKGFSVGECCVWSLGSRCLHLCADVDTFACFSLGDKSWGGKCLFLTKTQNNVYKWMELWYYWLFILAERFRMEHSCLDVLDTLELTYKSSGQGDLYSGFFTEGEKAFSDCGGTVSL